MEKAVVGVLGATSLIGNWLLPLLCDRKSVTFAFSRQKFAVANAPCRHALVRWCQLPLTPYDEDWGIPDINNWICLAPIWTLPNYFSMLAGLDANRLVALSSTSRFTKQHSTSPKERRLAQNLKQAEELTAQWAADNKVQLTVLRPTLIYGTGNDGNISLIMRFISYFGFFPLFGTAQGLRQPVHGADVAQACLMAIENSRPGFRCLQISGADVLTYEEMIARIFTALGKKPRFVYLPVGVFRVFAAVLSFFPFFRDISVSMAERMSTDLAFDHSAAKKELGFSPRGFYPVKVI